MIEALGFILWCDQGPGCFAKVVARTEAELKERAIAAYWLYTDKYQLCPIHKNDPELIKAVA